ncbi:hypothetical protein LTR53_016273, partial [Teratosphaeriaceae sp. CCFEE 6253]
DRQAPLGVLLSRAMVHAGLIRPLSEGKQVLVSQVRYVVGIVQRVEGNKVAARLDRLLWDLRWAVRREGHLRGLGGEAQGKWDEEGDKFARRTRGKLRRWTKEPESWVYGDTVGDGRDLRGEGREGADWWHEPAEADGARSLDRSELQATDALNMDGTGLRPHEAAGERPSLAHRAKSTSGTTAPVDRQSWSPPDIPHTPPIVGAPTTAASRASLVHWNAMASASSDGTGDTSRATTAAHPDAAALVHWQPLSSPRIAHPPPNGEF